MAKDGKACLAMTISFHLPSAHSWWNRVAKATKGNKQKKQENIYVKTTENRQKSDPVHLL